jgi:hypothetical protein
VLGGVGSCLVVVVCALVFPELRRADRLQLASGPVHEEADDEQLSLHERPT